MRFELIHLYRHYPLKVACLPIPPLAQLKASLTNNVSTLRNNLSKVPKTGIEPARRETLAPETSASTNSATWATFSPQSSLRFRSIPFSPYDIRKDRASALS